MFTPDLLLQLASRYEARYLELLALHPPGTINDERNEARRKMEQARICADWMTASGISELKYVGPFGDLPLRKGSRVRIRKGALVRGRRVGGQHGDVPAKTAFVVTLHDVDQGYAGDRCGREQEVRQPRVTWAGAGGYWRSVDANDVELVA